MERLVLGTWQFALKECSIEYTEHMISFALDCGIRWFDTAQVYGNGMPETILGNFPQAKVITKIPAMIKPDGNGLPLERYYTRDYILDCCDVTRERLKRPADILLLHNWTDDWNDHEELYEWMAELKRLELCKAVGVSLPDSYNGRVIPYPFDWIMAPLNRNANWIAKHHDELNSSTAICVRSLFRRGMQIPEERCGRVNCIHNAYYADKIVIGMTREESIRENISIFKEEG